MTDLQSKTFSLASPVLLWERMIVNNANVVSYLMAGYRISFTEASRDRVIVSMRGEAYDYVGYVMVDLPKAMCGKTVVTFFTTE